MGSIFRVNIFESNHLLGSIEWLKKKKYKFVGLAMDGVNINKMELKNIKNTVFIFGSESHGIRPEVEKLLDKKYTIMRGPSTSSGQAESLNVAISVGILLSKI